MHFKNKAPPNSANKENIGSQKTKFFPSLFQAHLFVSNLFAEVQVFLSCSILILRTLCSFGRRWKSIFMHLCRISHVLQTEWHNVNISPVFSLQGEWVGGSTHHKWEMLILYFLLQILIWINWV